MHEGLSQHQEEQWINNALTMDKQEDYHEVIVCIKADNTEQVLIVMSAPSKPSWPSCMKASVGTKRSSKRVTFDFTPEFVKVNF